MVHHTFIAVYVPFHRVVFLYIFDVYFVSLPCDGSAYCPLALLTNLFRVSIAHFWKGLCIDCLSFSTIAYSIRSCTIYISWLWRAYTCVTFIAWTLTLLVKWDIDSPWSDYHCVSIIGANVRGIWYRLFQTVEWVIYIPAPISFSRDLQIRSPCWPTTFSQLLYAIPVSATWMSENESTSRVC